MNAEFNAPYGETNVRDILTGSGDPTHHIFRADALDSLRSLKGLAANGLASRRP